MKLATSRIAVALMLALSASALLVDVELSVAPLHRRVPFLRPWSHPFISSSHPHLTLFPL